MNPWPLAALAFLSGAIVLFLINVYRNHRAGKRRISLLEEINERTMLMLDTSPLCAQIWDRNLNTIDCNEAGVKLYGFKDKREYVDKFLEHCSPEYQPDGQRSDEKAVRLVKQAFECGYCKFDWTHKIPYRDTLIPAEVELVRAKYKDNDVVVGYTRDLRIRHKLMDDIEHRNKLLQTVNEASVLLLTADSDIDSAIKKGMEMISGPLGADRIHIWQCKANRNENLYLRRYSWVGETGMLKAQVDNVLVNPSGKDALDWKGKFLRGENISGPVSKLPENDRKFLSKMDVESIIIIPLMLDGAYWGLFSVDNCTDEREYTPDEINILKSVSLMMANAISRLFLNEKIKEAHSRTELLLNKTPLCCQLWDESLQKIDCNEEAVRLFGFNDKQDYLKRYHLLYPELQPDGTPSVEKSQILVKQAFEEGRAVFEWNYKMLDGTIMPAEVTLIRVKRGDGYVIAGYTRDMREYNKMMHAIQYRDSMLQAVNKMSVELLNSGNDDFESVLQKSMGIIAEAADVDCVYLWKNHITGGELYCSQIFEWSLSKTMFADSTPYKYNEVVPGWEEALSNGRYINGLVSEMSEEEQRHLSPSGILSILVVPIFIKDKFWGFVGFDDCRSERVFTKEEESALHSASLLIAYSFIRNQMVCEIRETSLRLKSALKDADDAAKKAHAASSAKSDFLSTMSHEIRTPMNAIIGMSTIGKSAEELEMKNYAFGKIETASSQLLDLINNILDMAKIEEGKMALFPAEYSFEEMLAKVLAVIRVASDEKNQIITVKADDKIPTFLIGDDLRLSQVITNILANAVKFTPEGGSIHLEAALAGETGGICELRVEIADNGIGLSPEHMDTLFDAFEQAESGTTRAYGGTGLGLAISKRIVEAMGGSIRVESEPEKGAKFIFTVHAGRGTKNSAGTPERPSGGTLRGKKMLAVEDMATNRTVLKMLLKDSGLDIEFAVNGKEAVEMVSAEPDRYDIIFMDVRMPEMNGLDATRHIRALPPRKRGPLPIIAMTANVFKEDIDACLESGMDEHLGKPVDIEKTMEVLHKYLGN